MNACRESDEAALEALDRFGAARELAPELLEVALAPIPISLWSPAALYAPLEAARFAAGELAPFVPGVARIIADGSVVWPSHRRGACSPTVPSCTSGRPRSPERDDDRA